MLKSGMVKVYLHFPHVLIAWCLINSAQGQLRLSYHRPITKRGVYRLCFFLVWRKKRRLTYAVPFLVWAKPEDLRGAQIVSANKRYFENGELVWLLIIEMREFKPSHHGQEFSHGSSVYRWKVGKHLQDYAQVDLDTLLILMCQYAKQMNAELNNKINLDQR